MQQGTVLKFGLSTYGLLASSAFFVMKMVCISAKEISLSVCPHARYQCN